MAQKEIVKVSQWSYAQRSDGTWILSGISDKKMWYDKGTHLELYTVISPKDKGEYIEFDLPGSYIIRAFKGQEKKKGKPNEPPI